MPAPKILVMSGSIRTGSHNTRLAALATKELTLLDADVTRISLQDYPLPLYDAEHDAREGQPASALQLKHMIMAHHGVFIASPEYSASVTPLLKNAIDWVSRAYPAAWRGKPGLLLSAAPSPVGGNRGAWAARVPLEVTGAILHPDVFSLPAADKAFDETGALTDAKMAARLDKVVAGFVAFAGALAKRA